jgi:hypothetical protein
LARSTGPRVIAGLYRGRDLVMVGRTVPLSAKQAAELGAVLRQAGKTHPWPDDISPTRWGAQRSKVALTKVAPLVVVEVSAEVALQAGQFRHPLRYARIRADLTPEDVPPLPQ